MEIQKTQIPCMVSALREVQNSEQTQELRLPDGMPDIGKVLCAWGQVILRSKEWRSDSILISGGMLMWVLYAPENGEQPQILDGWLPFQMRWMLPEGCAEGRMRITALTRFADARSVSPRKLMLRGGIGVLAEAMVPDERELIVPAKTELGIELLKRRYPVRIPKEAGEKAFSLEEDVNPGVRPEKLLYYTLKPEITEQKVLSNKIAFRGNANLHVAWMGSDGLVSSQDFAIPFSQFAELKTNYGSDARVDIQCCVTDLELVQQEEGMGLKAEIAAQYLVDDQMILETVEDAYAPGKALRMEKQELEIPAILEKRVELCTAEVQPAVSGQVVDVCFLPDFPRQYREEAGVALEIPGTVQTLYYDRDNQLRSSSARWEGKLQCTVSEDATLQTLPQVSAAPQIYSAGENLSIHSELPVQLMTVGGRGIPMVTELELGADTEPDPQRPSLILRRAGTDTLWEIAKLCGSTVDAIRSANSIHEEPRPGQMLLIPVS